MTFTPAAASPFERTSSFRLALRSALLTIGEKIWFGRSREAHHAMCLDLYHADETKLKELGLTRMDVIRLLKTKSPAMEQDVFGYADLPSRPAFETTDRKWEILPLARLGSGLVSF